MSLILPDGTEQSWTDAENGDNDLFAAADSFFGIFGYHRVSQKDIISHKEGHMDPANANNLPEATQSDIEQEFDSLVRSNSETTTLAVKESLRGRGFWVNQRDVSDCVWSFVQSNMNDYNFTYKHGHRVYRYAPISSSFAAQTPGTFASGSGNKAIYHKAKRVQVVGNWLVYAPGGNLVLLPTETYSGVTRNKARYDYAKQYNVPYVTTIAKKL